MVRSCWISFLAVVVVFLAGCPSEPKPWVPDGKRGTDTLGDGGVRSADVSVVPDTPFIDGTKTLPDGVDPVDTVEEVAQDTAPDLPPEVTCEPECEGVSCGPDGCGGSCGGCADGESCVFGNCVVPGEGCDDGNGEPWDGCTEGIVSEFRINTNQKDDQRQPAVATIGDDFIVVWQSCHWDQYEGTNPDHDGFGCGIFGAIVDTATGVGTEFKLNGEVLDNQLSADVAACGDYFVVSWLSYANGDYLAVRTFGADGMPLHAEATVDLVNHERTWRPAVACNTNGDILVVFDGFETPGDRAIMGQYFKHTKESLVSVGEATSINQVPFPSGIQNDYKPPRVLAQASGTFVVGWGAATVSTDDWDIYAQILDAPEFPLEADLRLNEGATQYDQRYPTLAAAADGFLALYVDDLFHDINDSGLSARAFDNAGAAQGSTIYVMTTGSSAEAPDVASAGGTSLAVWTHSVEDNEVADEIRITSVGDGPIAGTSVMSLYTDGYQKFPRLAGNSSGQFLIVWESCPWSPWMSPDDLPGQGEDGCGVFGRLIDANAL